MSRKPGDRARAGFAPKVEQLALLPEVSGNAINGFGETEVRRPRPIYWHPREMIAHGDLQQWFYDNGRDAEVAKIREASLKVARTPLPEPAPVRPERCAEEWSGLAKREALAREADMVGVARLDPNWVFEGYEADYPWIVVLGVGMDHDALKHAPGSTSQKEVQTQYGRGTRAAFSLARWIREQGYGALPHGGPRAGPVLMIPAAIAAGLGELGKHGSMINRVWGSSFRLACVLTDMPLLPDRPADFGADDFCAACRVCVDACPPDAIYTEKQPVRGARKWYVDFDKCVLYFNEHKGCGICIARCPWSRPGTAPRLAEKMLRRRRVGTKSAAYREQGAPDAG